MQEEVSFFLSFLKKSTLTHYLVQYDGFFLFLFFFFLNLQIFTRLSPWFSGFGSDFSEQLS